MEEDWRKNRDRSKSIEKRERATSLSSQFELAAVRVQVDARRITNWLGEEIAAGGGTSDRIITRSRGRIGARKKKKKVSPRSARVCLRVLKLG